MAGTFPHRVVYLTDERGVIVDSAVIGPDDELPEGFSDSAEYTSVVPQAQEQPPVESSELTAWKGLDLSQTVDAIKETAEAQEGATDPAGLRSNEEVGEDEPLGVEGTVEQTDEVVQADDGATEFDASQTVDEILGDRQIGTADPRGEESDDEGSEDAEEPALAEDGEESAASPPPRRGAGSGKEEWAQYAEAQGVEVPEDASRDEIIAAVDEAGKPV